LRNDYGRVKLSCEKRGGGFSAHIAFQDGLGRAAQVSHHQDVERVRKARVEIKSEYAPAGPHILLDQDRNALTIAFQVGYGRGEFFEVLREAADRIGIKVGATPRAIGRRGLIRCVSPGAFRVSR
jgi:hypothetical protein